VPNAFSKELKTMKKVIAALCASLALAGLTATAASANSTMMSSHPTHVKYMVCPYCHMKMYTHPSAAAPVAIKIKGVTYYCCAACKGGHSVKHM
jgi:hypothetical protein